MKNHQKLLFGIVLIFTFVMVLPTTLAFTETETFGSTLAEATRTIYEDEHRGRIQFSFTANDSLTVQIMDYALVQTLWGTTGTNGSCDLDVNKADKYRIRFSKSTGYAVEVEYTMIEQGGIPAFALVHAMFVLLATIGIIYLKKQKSFNQ